MRHRPGRPSDRLAAALAALCVLAAGARSAPAQDPEPPRDLTQLSLEELANLEVSSASRKQQRLADVPAAVYVLRGEDIKRSGATSLPEALRLVPGVFVAKIDANKWIVSIRGFADRFGNKLQVLVDGRSIYSPLFSGVFWDSQDTRMEDIDRIEVVRGPGASVWGANAVNGVINIITKKSQDTQGGELVAGAGSEERGFGSVRHGGRDGDVAYRAFGKYFDRDAQKDGNDAWWQARGGFRLDWEASRAETLTLAGEYYRGQSGTEVAFAQPAPVYATVSTAPYEETGGFVLARWERKLSDTSSLSLQGSVTVNGLETPFFGEARTTVDVDAVHRFSPWAGNDLVWGLGYRWTQDDLDNSFSVSMDPRAETDDVLSAFFQDELQLVDQAVWLTVGARFEHNDYTGFEVQPTARLSMRLHDDHLVWLAASRAVRTPSRAENSIRINAAVIPAGAPPPPPETWVSVFGADDLESELVTAFELGYRVQPAATLSLDLAAFLNVYDQLRSTEPGTPGPEGTHLLVPRFMDDLYAGRSYGGEVSAVWQPVPEIRVHGSYSLFRIHLDPQDSLDAGNEGFEEESTPVHMASARVAIDLVRNVSLDLMGRYVSAQDARSIDAFFEADVRLAWRVSEKLEIALVGQNLVHDDHFESDTSGLNETATAVERGVYGSLTLKF